MAIRIGGKNIAGLVVGTSSGNKDVVEVWQGSSSGNKLVWQRSVADNYVLATDADFSGTTNGAFRYIGTGEYVIIPDTIKGVAVTSYYRMFRSYSGLQLKGVRSRNKNIINMSEMFFNCESTEPLDLSGLDTSSVTNMDSMFFQSQATELNLSNFDTSKVTSFGRMFWRAKVTELDLRSFDTRDISAYEMFYLCAATIGYARTPNEADKFNALGSGSKPAGLTFVFVPSPTDYYFSGTTNGSFRYIGTEKVVSMPHIIKGSPVTSYNNMFNTDNGKLVEKVISDNTNVTDMSYMFNGSQATKLDLSNLDTSSVTNMSSMFENSAAPVLDLSSFDTSNVTDMSYMFTDSAATKIDVSGFDTSNVTTMRSMFNRSKATELNLSGFNTSNVTNMMYMFQSSPATTLDLSSFDVSKLTSTSYMFTSCSATTGYARTQADADKLNAVTSKPAGLTFIVKHLATDDDFSGTTNNSFKYVGTNKYIIMPNVIKGVPVTSYKSMFDSTAGKLVEGIASNNTNVTNMSSMFYGSKATKLDLSNLDTSSVTNMSYMFYGSKATVLDLSSFDTSNVTTANMYYMFFNSSATIGYARTQADADRFNASSGKPSKLTFVVK